MWLAYIHFIAVCGVISAAPLSDNTPDERRRILGPYASIDTRAVFPCKGLDPSPEVPTSVHKLKPADIRCIAAIGDSLTAASGAGSIGIISLLFQYRGVAWCIGGDDSLDSRVTLPNILLKYNRNLYGYSIGSGNQNSSNARFNLARPGAVSSEMPDQANMLVDRMISQLGVTEFNSAWKLVTFFIGGNDLCTYCEDVNKWSPQMYRANVQAALDILYRRMPRTLVNFVTVLNVAELEDLHDGWVCQNMQLFLCDCAINEDTREVVRAASILYQQETTSLIKSGVYTKEDFTVVIQPFMEHMKVPTTPQGLADFSYFASDCFHFSSKGHEAAAVELWNNMMEPVGKKVTVWNLADTLHCPLSVDGYIFTTENSK